MEKGLTAQEVEQKRQQFGKNEISTTTTISPLGLFLSQFPTLINGILAAASLLSFFIHDTIDAVFILAILIVNATLGFIQEYRAEKSLEKLKDLSTPIALVLRDGKEQQIPANELVPKDVVLLSEGNKVPADGTLITATQVEVDESLLTGESIPVAKGHKEQLFSATLLTRGKATLLVEKTGMQTRFGQIAQTLSTLKIDKTPLQTQLDTLGKMLSIAVLVIALLLIPIGFLQGKTLLPIILIAVSIGIAAIPEGLPAIITIALAIGTNRMAKKRAIVRKMPAIETLGAVQVILTDKTGTLTQNSMAVKKHWLIQQPDKFSLLRACVLGNTATLVQQADSKQVDVVGDKTDAALLVWAQTQAHMKDLVDDGTIVDEYTFDSETKTITTAFLEAGKKYIYVRGAPEAVIAKSTLTESDKQKATEIFESFAKEGYRVIGFAAKQEHHKTTSRSHIEQGLDFLGLVALYDPPRKEAYQAVREADQAGIKTVMVTGDNELTALAIAKEIGLIQKNEDVLTGNDMQRLSDEELLKLLPKIRIFARTQPEDKLRLVNLYKQQGYIVGVTGDGVNDALALKRSDVGVAMGQSGTDVAKEASDIVLTDDNFSTLVGAVEEGRTIYRNILTSITYLLTGNLSELALIFLATIFGYPTPLLPTQILWVNLITDGFPALALAGDTKDPRILKEEPRSPKAQILSGARIGFISLVGGSLALLLFLLFIYLLNNTSSEDYARTIIFNTLIFSHLLLAFVVRGRSLLRVNKFLLFSLFISIAVQLLISTIPVFQDLFHLQF